MDWALAVRLGTGLDDESESDTRTTPPKLVRMNFGDEPEYPHPHTLSKPRQSSSTSMLPREICGQLLV